MNKVQTFQVQLTCMYLVLYSIISILVCSIAFKLLGLQLSSTLISRVGNILDTSTLNNKPEF